MQRQHQSIDNQLLPGQGNMVLATLMMSLRIKPTARELDRLSLRRGLRISPESGSDT